MGEESYARLIFAGPSLYQCQPEPLPDELWLPPACCGDIVRAAMKYHPRQVLLIDGCFHQSLAVWHKEVLWCLLEGITFIGAASMRALRCAELWRYGAIGVGKIFEAFRDYEEDDSLVAMTFEPNTCRPLSESKVGAAQKTQDALAAIDFARDLPYDTKVSCPLDKSILGPYIETVMERINA